MKKEDTREILEAFFADILQNTYEGQRLNALLKGEEGEVEPWLIPGYFQSVAYQTPEHYSYMPSVEKLWEEEYIADQDKWFAKMRETFSKPWKEFMSDKFKEFSGIKGKVFKIKEVYLKAPKWFSMRNKPEAVVLLSFNEFQINEVNVWSLERNELETANLTDLENFDHDVFREKRKEWETEYHRGKIREIEDMAN